ncbi:catalase family protein [Limobrevibacterium gyesilva]|uniref:Catalase family protein n=1 Tax=Limobrevibacterium gyesilva TaxID=2991712 RepID=A0AA41YM71_9PROT|nr:catalase family protein [Limobrevibacterium gyesilva]MCW3475290.1 catalase family protein [Limobrevibacterium gyesilva]
MLLQALHRALIGLLHVERRVDPFFRPLFDRLLQEPLASLAQALILRRQTMRGAGLAEETMLPDEEACVASIVADMAGYMRANHAPGHFERAGNTKTHGVVRGAFTVFPDLPLAFRHGLFATPRAYPAWVRFAGPGPDSPPDIDDVGVLSIGIKVMGVPGAKLLDDERFTQDFTAISTPTFTTPNLRENAKLQAAIRRGLPLFYFVNLHDSHLLDAIMQGLWARTQSSPLETPYWGCVPYALGTGQAMQYALHPRLATRSHVPRLPLRPPDNYLREAMAATLARGEAAFDFVVQLQTDPVRMPIENASVRWPAQLSPPVRVATLTLPRQVFDSAEQLAFASRLSINPWHCLPEHRPLGNQNRGRLRIYTELSRLRQEMNATPHEEPTGEETFGA